MYHPVADVVAAELDAVHRQARDSYQSKDLRAYMDAFAPDLTYKAAPPIPHDTLVAPEGTLLSITRTRWTHEEECECSVRHQELG